MKKKIVAFDVPISIKFEIEGGDITEIEPIYNRNDILKQYEYYTHIAFF